MAASGSTESDREGAETAAPSRIGHIRIDGFTLPKSFPKIKDQIRRMDILPDDVWVCSLPRSGARWVQEAIWCILHNVDLETAKETKERQLDNRFPYLEQSILLDYEKMTDLPEYLRDSVGFTERFTPPRLIKTHIPLAFLPEKLTKENGAKIVYITRNPRDLCIANYNHSLRVGACHSDFEKFCESFLMGKARFLPYWEHVFQFWRIRNKPNILFIMFEDMEKDLPGQVVKIATFFGRTLTEDQLNTLIEHVLSTLSSDMEQFESLRGANMGSSQSGQQIWEMSQSMVQRFQEWSMKHLKQFDYSLVHD